jgi:hypothetical protein
MATRASWSLPISTKPKPLDSPVSRSTTTRADRTVPYCPKICRRSFLAPELDCLALLSLQDNRFHAYLLTLGIRGGFRGWITPW